MAGGAVQTKYLGPGTLARRSFVLGLGERDGGDSEQECGEREKKFFR